MEIVGDIKTYDWGKLGNTSEVAKLAKLNCPNFVINEDLPYAELWMGDHISGSAVLKSDGRSLKDVLEKAHIGNQNQLPFLLKVLSIRQALSIQVHPNKAQAEKLHRERPDIYKDPNHKPEMAIALTPFLALCGFREYNQILDIIQKIQPLGELLGKNNVAGLKTGRLGLKACYSTLMKSRTEEVSKCIKDITEECNKTLKEYYLSDIFNTINHDFPNDVGVLSIFFLNVIQLKPGQAIFLGANVPHAYLSGDCVECMACSDNVIRAGLTPKFKDVDTLLEMLNYDGEPADKKIFKSNRCDGCLELFIPPNIKDFAVAKFVIPLTENSYDWKNNKFGSIILVTTGKRIMRTNLGDLNLKPGSIVFIPGNCGDVQFIKSNDCDA